MHSSAKHLQGHAFAARLALRLGVNMFSWAIHDGQFVKNLDVRRIDQAIVDHAGNTIACRNWIAVLEFPKS